MARVALVAVLLAGCGIASRDYTITQAFTAGGGAPTSASVSSSQLLAPLSADVSQVKTVELSSATIDALDSGDLTLIQSVAISAQANGGQPVTLATYSGPPAAGTKSISLSIVSSDLKPFLQAGAVLSANVQYVQFPATARSLQLSLTIHGSLL